MITSNDRELSNIMEAINGVNPTHVIFDIDGTLSDTNIGTYYFYLKKHYLPSFEYRLWKLAFSMTYLPSLLITDRISRAKAQQIVFGYYNIFDEDSLRSLVNRYFDSVVLDKCFSNIASILKECQKHYTVVLLSSNFDIIVEQYARHFNVKHWHGLSLSDWRKGKYSFQKLKSFKENIVHQCYKDKVVAAFADSTSDLPVLRHAQSQIVVSKKQPQWATQLQNATHVPPQTNL